MKIKTTTKEGAMLPIYKSFGASGADVCALLTEDVVLKPFQRAVIPTGLCFQIPKGYEVQIRARSGIAANNGVMVLNSPGTIDSDYRGEVKVILMNLGGDVFTISNGDRIAQAVVCPVVQGEFIVVGKLDDSERGDEGFGSTGIR